MTRHAPLPAATLERINAIPDADVRAYELDAAFQQHAAHTHYSRALNQHRQHCTPEPAEPAWIDATLVVLFVIACFVLAAIWDARDVERPAPTVQVRSVK